MRVAELLKLKDPSIFFTIASDDACSLLSTSAPGTHALVVDPLMADIFLLKKRRSRVSSKPVHMLGSQLRVADNTYNSLAELKEKLKLKQPLSHPCLSRTRFKSFILTSQPLPWLGFF